MPETNATLVSKDKQNASCLSSLTVTSSVLAVSADKMCCLSKGDLDAWASSKLLSFSLFPSSCPTDPIKSAKLCLKGLSHEIDFDNIVKN